MPPKPPPGKSLADLYPTLTAEWSFERNDGLTPSDVTYASNRKVWWRCGVCGREWVARVESRTRRANPGCGPCKQAAAAEARARPVPGRSLADVNPGMAEQWHPTRNGEAAPTDVYPKSGVPRWWRCSEGHEWFASPANRGMSCPECPNGGRSMTKRIPKPGRSLADRRPDVAAEWHPTRNGTLTPRDVHPGAKILVWWRCGRCGHEYQADPNHRTRHELPSRCQHRRRTIW